MTYTYPRFDNARTMLRLAFLGSSMIYSSTVWAQSVSEPNQDTTESGANTGIADIVVTAERFEQNVQKAPLTIQVLDGEALNNAGVTSAQDLGKLTTGVEIGSGGANSQIFIRGVGAFAFSPISSPGVAVNVDGVYVGRPNGVNGNFYDLARVEVLKGPQGTLYGRNANGGSINLITNAPKLGASTLDLNVEAGNYNLIHSSGAVNLPLGDSAAFRAAFNIVNRDGYLSSGANDDMQQSGRVRFKWEPSTAVTLQLSGDYTHLGGKGGDFVFLPLRPGASPYESNVEPAANAYLHGFGPLGPLVDDKVNDTRQNSTLYNLSAQLDWTIGDFATLTLLPAYRYVHARYVTHFDARFEGDETSKQTSFEVRLGNSRPGLTWVAGGYFFRETAPDSVDTVIVSDILQNYRLSFSPKTTAYAVFGQATVEVATGLRVIAGGRYTTEDRFLTGRIDNYGVKPPALLENFGGKEKFDGFTYKFGAEYDLGPRNLLFLTYSTGFKAGGLSQTVSPNVYQPERLRSLEFGSRNRLFDNRLQFNFGAFHWKYKQIQDQRVNFDPLGNVNFLTFNSGDATLYGANVDIVAKPTPRDTLSLSGEYAHSKYDRFFFQTPVPFLQPGSNGCPQSGPYAPGATLPFTQQGSNTNDGPLPVIVGNCAGFQVARVPRWSGNISYEHMFELTNGATLAVSGSIKYSSTRWLNIDFIPAERDPRYAVVDADINYTSSNGQWTIGLFGRNITKTVYYTGGIESSFIGGLFNANIAPPRTYGVRASVKFGN